METIVRNAMVEDKERLILFLEAADLGTIGVEEGIDYFLLVENEAGAIQATIGIEPLGDVGLLRSLAMTEGMTENDLLLIFEQMLALAREKQLRSLYLATNKPISIPFFAMLGFAKVDKEKLPEQLYQSGHVKNILIVDNSLFMSLNL